MGDLSPNVLAPLVATAVTVVAFIKDVPVLEDVLVGAGAGAIFGKYVAWRRERRDGRELANGVVRRIEIAWIGVFSVVAALVSGLLLALD